MFSNDLDSAAFRKKNLTGASASFHGEFMQSVRLNLLSSVLHSEMAGQNLEKEYMSASKPQVESKSPDKKRSIVDKNKMKESEQNKGFGAFCFF